MYYITGDTHREFEKVYELCENNDTTVEDVLIILGDVGINFYCNSKDVALKNELSQLPITLFCIHGNHEERPFNLDYEEKEWNEGIVYYEEEYPNLLFAKDGEIYNIDGNKCLVLGGAYSVDKYYRLANHLEWFEDEQPSDEIKEYAEQRLDEIGWSVDFVFSHTVPYDYRPTWNFIPGLDESRVDNSTEEWLQEIENKLSYKEWFAGHFHVDSTEGPITLIFDEISELMWYE